MTSTLPSAIPSSIASRSAVSRSGGFIFMFVSYGSGEASISSVNTKWWGVTSQVTLRAARLAVAHRVEGLPRAHVGDVDDASGQLRERDIALRHDRLGFSRDAAKPERRRLISLVRDTVALQRLFLAVVDDGQVEHARVFEGPPHQHRRRHGPPVVGQRNAARELELGDIGQLLAFLPA